MTGIRAEALYKVFGEDDRAVLALQDVNLEIAPREIVSLTALAPQP